MCPVCRRDTDPFVAHFCNDPWEKALSTRPSASTIDTFLRHLIIHEDHRGTVRETFRASWNRDIPPIQQIVRSQSIPHTLRGMHLHLRQWDIWHIASGSALVRLLYADGSEHYERLDAGLTLAIPPGVAHGFYTEEGCTLMYALTEEYDGTDEYGFYPFDGMGPDAHPGWPKSHLGLVVSERDLRAQRLDDPAFRARVGW